MAEAPAGIVGKIAANRPLLAISVLSFGLIALSLAGARHANEAGGAVPLNFVFNALYILAAPICLAALQPKRIFPSILYFAFLGLVAAALIAFDTGNFASLSFIQAPPWPMTLAAFGFTVYLAALAPMASNVARLAIAAPFAVVLGAAGGAGFLSLESLWGTTEAASALALALTLGAATGVSISADFATFFSGGANRKHAAAAAGHSAVATTAFSLLAVAAYFGVQTFNANFGAVEWRILWAGFTMAAASMVTVIFAVTGSLAITNIGEETALYENRRRRWFSAAWRPVRFLLPPTTAIAVSLIAGVFVVIALFEAGFSAPVSLAVFFIAIWMAAAVSFVSLRTSFVIVSLLAISAIFTGYLFAIAGIELPALRERLLALALSAVALGHLTVSWRNAGDVWRNVRDVVENALSDGTRRYLFVVGAGAASLYIAAVSLAWEAGASAVIYFVSVSFFSLLLAPALMTALSAQMRRF